jgi:DNA primase
MHDPDMKGEESDPLIVADFIYEELNRDGISFNTPVHQQILIEYEEHYKEEHFNAEKYFLFHPNQEIARLTSELITEKYTLSKIHARIKKIDSDAERLFDLAPRIVNEYKNCLVSDIYKETLISLKIASETKDYTRAEEIMKELKNLDEIKKQLAKTLGERVITKF